MPGTSDFGTFGRYTELSLDEMTADQKRVYEFTVKQRGEVPGPYKIWLQNPKLIEVMVPLGAYYQGHSSHSGRIAGCVTDGVDDDLGLRDLVENEIGVRRRRHPANRRIARAASDVRML